jgi:hypothetical protein
VAEISATDSEPRMTPLTPTVVFTLERFKLIEDALRGDGYGEIIEWSENIPPPRTCRHFASAAIYVIAASGLRVTLAKEIHRRCMRALRKGKLATSVFGHPGKAAAMDRIWDKRKILFKLWRHIRDDKEKVIFCGELPFVGEITKFHLAKNLGVNTIKPDVHMDRLARAEGYRRGTCVTAWRSKPVIAKRRSTRSYGRAALTASWTRPPSKATAGNRVTASTSRGRGRRPSRMRLSKELCREAASQPADPY